MTDTTTTASVPAAAPAPTSLQTFFADLEAKLSADAQKAVAFLKQLAQAEASILAKAGSGLPIIISEFETLLQSINTKLPVINASIGAVKAEAATAAPNNTALQKLISDVEQGVNDAAEVSTALSSGSAAGDNTVVTTAVATVTAVNSLAALASQASAMLGQASVDSPNATQAVSPASPPED